MTDVPEYLNFPLCSIFMNDIRAGQVFVRCTVGWSDFLKLLLEVRCSSHIIKFAKFNEYFFFFCKVSAGDDFRN